MGFLFELRLIENYQSKIIIIMAEQEELFNDLEQEIRPPINGNKKMTIDTKEKGKT